MVLRVLELYQQTLPLFYFHDGEHHCVPLYILGRYEKSPSFPNTFTYFFMCFHVRDTCLFTSFVYILVLFKERRGRAMGGLDTAIFYTLYWFVRLSYTIHHSLPHLTYPRILMFHLLSCWSYVSIIPLLYKRVFIHLHITLLSYSFGVYSALVSVDSAVGLYTINITIPSVIKNIIN